MSMKKQQGFSMVEVLVSMMIIVFGVLGMAGTQMLAINNTENARYQSIAAVYASSLAAMMQGNSQFWASPQNISVSGSSGSLVISGFSPVPTYLDCVANVCTKRVIAYYDITKWGGAVINSLPAGQATIACGATPTTCTITMTWNEKSLATGKGVSAVGTIQGHTYQTLVAIN